jgi:hypothetical protein
MLCSTSSLAPDALARLHLAHFVEHLRAVQTAADAAERSDDHHARAAFETALRRASARLGSASVALERECQALVSEGHGGLVDRILGEREHEMRRLEVEETIA